MRLFSSFAASATLLCFVFTEASHAAPQRGGLPPVNGTAALGALTGAADASWSGYAQCKITMQGVGYVDEVTHTWMLTGGSPTRESDVIRAHPATWTVTGTGRRDVTTPEQHDQWATQVEMSAPISIWITPGGLLRIARRANLTSPQGITGTTVIPIPGVPAPSRPFAYSVSEWPFPQIEVPPSTAVSNTSSTVTTQKLLVFQPVGTTGTVACAWNFTSSGSPAPSTSPGATPAGQSSAAPRTRTLPNVPPPTTSVPTAQPLLTPGELRTPTTTTPVVGGSGRAGAPPPDASVPLPPFTRSASNEQVTALAANHILSQCALSGPGVTSGPVATSSGIAFAFNRVAPWAVGYGWGMKHVYAWYDVRRNDRPQIVLQKWETVPWGGAAQTTTFEHTTTLSPGVAYAYTIVAHYFYYWPSVVTGNWAGPVDGGCGVTTVNVTVPAP